VWITDGDEAGLWSTEPIENVELNIVRILRLIDEDVIVMVKRHAQHHRHVKHIVEINLICVLQRRANDGLHDLVCTFWFLQDDVVIIADFVEVNL
jgi:hypothetical protein